MTQTNEHPETAIEESALTATPARSRLAEKLAAMDPLARSVSLVLMARLITRRPFHPDIFTGDVLGRVYEIRFGDRVLGQVAQRPKHRGAKRWRIHGTPELFPTLRAAERRLVEQNIREILPVLSGRSAAAIGSEAS